MFGSIFSSMIDGIFSAHRDSANRTIQREQLALAEKEYYSNLDLMLKNFGLQQEAFNYNKEQAELTRQREDNAFQRRVQDYVKAGFSPLAAQGVAGSSQAPTLTAPQYDPSGVNQATSNRLNAYQNAIANNNQTAQLKLQQQQLKLAQLETVKSMAESVFSIRGQILNNDRLKAETDWYNIHGYRDQTFQTLISDFINGFGDSFNGNVRDLGKWSADKIQNGWNSMIKKVLDLGLGNKNFTDNSFFNSPFNLSKNFDKKNSAEGYKITKRQVDDLFYTLKKARDGQLSPIAIEQLKAKLEKYFDTDMGLPYGRWKSLSQQEYENILKQIQERLSYVR